MTARSSGLFARRGIPLPSAKVTAIAVVTAFAIGLIAGWATSQLPGWLEAQDAPVPSASPSAEPSPEPIVSVPPLTPIVREITEEDEQAGLITLEYPYEADGTTTVVSGETNPLREGVPIRYVSVEVEDGLDVNPRTFAGYVMAILNDARGWGANNRMQYVRTDGAADYRVVLASPYTSALMCPDRHGVGPEPGGVDVASLIAQGFSGQDSESPDPSTLGQSEPDADQDESGDTCASQGVLVVSLYDWAAGLEAFEESVVASRVYFVQHGMGHLLGEADLECERGRAPVMVNHRDLPEACEANPWPFPDVAVDTDADSENA